MSTLTRHDFLESGAMDSFFIECDRCKGRKYLEDGITLCPKCDGGGGFLVREDAPAEFPTLYTCALALLLIAGLASFWVLLSWFR